jgi:ParB/RepB/Spo0J family partition protein
MPISWVDLDLIVRNPFQTRDHEDPEHVKALAESIQLHGLMQYPVARLFEGIYQLAFGHSRAAAYRQLYMAGQDVQWASMPVVVQDLSDLQMFEFAVTENLERKDLTPVEEARAMQTYQTTFHKNSDETGRLFHVTGSTVRGKLRLLDLPDTVQSQIGGSLSEATARKLLTLQAVAPADKVTAVSRLLSGSGPVSESFVNETVKAALRDSAFSMWGGYYAKKGEPRGGVGLWPLTWTPGVLEIKAAAINKLFEERGLKTPGGGTRFEAEKGGDVEAAFRAIDYPAEQVEPAATILTCLVNPPACTTCPLHTVLDGGHWCGLKACWERKRKAWYAAELERLSKELGIAVYDKDKDGALFEEGSYTNSEQYKKWMAAKANHLRLKVDYQEYSAHELTSSNVITVISVRPEAIKAIQSKKDREKNREVESRNQQDRWKLEQELQRASELFIQQVAAPFFANALNPLENLGLMEWLIDNSDMVKKLPAGRKDKLAALRVIVVSRWLTNRSDYQMCRAGPTAIAAWLQGLALGWGVALPPDWTQIAERAMPGYLAPIIEEKVDAEA